MPNYCGSNIIVTGPAADIARFREACFVTDDYGRVEFSLDSFVPEPECLYESEPAFDADLALIALGVDPDEPVPYVTLTLERVLGFEWAREAGIVSRADLLAYLEENSPDGVAAAHRRLANFAETGFYDWRQWREANWGTIRSPEGTEIQVEEPGRLVFGFSTAWSFPDTAFRVLGVLYPNLTFDVAALVVELNHAMVGQVKGASMSLRQTQDYEAVYRRVMGDDDAFDCGADDDAEPATTQ